MHSKKIEISTLNTRDLGGILTEDGSCIKDHCLLRSNALFNVPESDMMRLYDEYNLRKIYDFRFAPERYGNPDTRIQGIEYISHVLQETKDYGMAHDEESREKIRQYFTDLRKRLNTDRNAVIEHMAGFYRSMALSDFTAGKYRVFLHDVLESEGTVLWHCSLGKDRAGIATVLILEILGVSKENIYEDYLFTNYCLYGNGEPASITDLMDWALPEYLDAYYEGINGKYGSMKEFLEFLGINEEVRNRFKNKYLIKESRLYE